MKGWLGHRYSKQEVIGSRFKRGNAEILRVNLHCTKNKVFHQGFLQQMGPNTLFRADWSHLLKKYLIEIFIFCASLLLMSLTTQRFGMLEACWRSFKFC